MSYDQSKLIKDVRIYLGGVPEEILPESTIVYWGDFWDAPDQYEGNYPYILWKTTLCSIEYLKASVSTSSQSSAVKTTSKEKVGDVQVDYSTEAVSITDQVQVYDDLYKDYSDNPWKFGITPLEGSSVVHINGVNQEEVEKYRTNKNTTSIYNPLPATAFPKSTGCGRVRDKRNYRW